MRSDLLPIAFLTLGVLAVHGYHPWAEDGGLYVAGTEYTLDPSLFPHERAFVTEHLRYSVFAPVIASVTRFSHLSLATVLFCTYLLSTALTLLAALHITRKLFASSRAHWIAVALFAAWWTLPVAGTSLLLMDPYVTARSLSMPLSLFAISAALEPWSSNDRAVPAHRAQHLHPALTCVLLLLLAAAFHPLMAAYAVVFVLAIRLTHSRSALGWIALASATLIAAAVAQALALPETPPVVAAAYSRYYWFLSQWHWFEWLGIIAPLAIFFGFLRAATCSTSPSRRALSAASIGVGLLAIATALLFAQEHFRAHPVARIQPLRAFAILYVLMILLCGGALGLSTEHFSQRLKASPLSRSLRVLPIGFIAGMALIMFFVQRASFPSSIHIELPGRTNPNPWVQAFLWARANTPPDALFALDARYVNTDGEDAQTFRALAQRSAIPDFSKDGGEAALTPRLAPEWERSAAATQHLSEESDAQRLTSLQPFGVDWLILHSDAPTQAPCPYRNPVVKVCHLSPPLGHSAPPTAVIPAPNP